MTIGAGAIVFNKKRQVLLVKRKDLRAWAYPVGRVKKGETLEDGCIRELKEETGVNVSIKSLSGIYIRTIPSLKNVTFVYRCDYKNGKLLKQEDEVLDLGWFDVESLPRPILTGMEEIIRDALDKDKLNPTIRIMNKNDLWVIRRFLAYRLKRSLGKLEDSSKSS